jgi:hypothetical protein
MIILIHTNCVYYLMVYSTGYCDCVHHDLKICTKCFENIVYITKFREEIYFCSKEMFTSRTLTGDEILLSVSMLFQLNETTNISTGIREHSHHYGSLHFISQQTHKHTHTHTHRYYFFRNSY